MLKMIYLFNVYCPNMYIILWLLKTRRAIAYMMVPKLYFLNYLFQGVLTDQYTVQLFV